jgi:hypothetical protein
VDLLERKTIEDLQDVLLARLAPRAPEPVPLAEGDDLCRIYLICDQEDNPLDSTPPQEAPKSLTRKRAGLDLIACNIPPCLRQFEGPCLVFEIPLPQFYPIPA